MAKYEITVTCGQWTDKSSQPDEDAIKGLLDSVLVDVETDMDEVDWTITDAKWEISVYGEYECADNDEANAIATKVEQILFAAGFRQVTWSWDEEDYPMPEHEILETFRDTILPGIPQDDRIAKAEAFSNYTDSLCKNGMITAWQYENIANPW